MSCAIQHARIATVLTILGLASGIFATPVRAGHFAPCADYHIVQGYVIQPQSATVASQVATVQAAPAPQLTMVQIPWASVPAQVQATSYVSQLQLQPATQGVAVATPVQLLIPSQKKFRFFGR